jgi:aryl-alcohol dehydrogenase-like predicted oxidoreductase
MGEHRSRFFLATKTGERDGTGARRSLERSLERLRVDAVDLVQLHNLVEEDEWAEAHGKGGALEALVGARDEGLVRFIGVTGHGTRIPRMHLRSLEHFAYDSVLLPYNPTMMAIDSYARDVEALLALAAERDVAVQTIKSIARRRFSAPPAPGERRLSWYEPLTDAGAIARGVDYVLSRPRLFLNTTSDFRLLPAVLEAAQQPPRSPAPDALAADMARFEMTALFDGGALERM